MTILFDASAPVKSIRPFGRGLLASLPTYLASHTAADEAWLVADNARREAEDEDRAVDRRYSEVYAVDALTLGLIPIGATSIVGRND